MNRQTTTRFLLAGLTGLALLMGPGHALAQEEEPKQEESAAQEEQQKGFTFHVDPLVIGVLGTDVDSTSAKAEEYRDISNGLLLSLDVEGVSADGNREFNFEAVNASRDDARYTLNYGLSGRYNILVDYNKIPHRFGNGARLLWTETSPGVFEIADPIQQQLQDAVTTQFNTNRNGLTFPFLDNLLSPYLSTAQRTNLGLQRDRTLARIDLGSLGPLSWGIEYFHENRTGNRPFGSSFGFNNVTELPEPIDYDTTNAEVTAEWNGKSGGLRFGYRHSLFENNVDTMYWDNPFRITNSTDPSAYLGPSSSSINGSSTGFADLAPDNQANTVFADGRARFGNWWAAGSLSFNRMKQDDPLLPYTLNSSIVGIALNGSTFDPTNTANLPVQRADTQVDVLSLNGDAGTRFGKDFSLVFRYRYYDYDDKSPRIEFPGYVRYHGVWEDIPRITVPYAYTRQEIGAELGWDFAKTSRLGLGVKRRSVDRDFQDVDKSDEDILNLTFDSKPRSWVNIRASYELGDRNVDDYNVEAALAGFGEPEEVDNNPALRKFYLAAREYDQARLDTDFLFSEALTLTVGVSLRNEDYDESELGLISDDITQYNAELSYSPGEKLNFYIFGQRADRESFQRSRQSAATPSNRDLDNWEVTFDEATDTWGAGLNTKINERWTADFSGNWSRSDGAADFFAFAGGLPLSGTPVRTSPTDIDNYEDIELLSLLGRVDFKLSGSATVGLWYRYEDYTIDSFILQGLRNYLPGAILLNGDNGDFTANLFALELKLAF